MCSIAPSKNPQQRPIAASRYFAREFSRPDSTVLSLYCGIGTDVVAAMTLGRPAIGVDLNSKVVRSLGLVHIYLLPGTCNAIAGHRGT